MMPFAPGHDHVAVWRVEDDAARAHWRGTGRWRRAHMQKTLVSCWDVASRRIVRDDVTFPDAASLAKEEAARARIKAQGSEVVSAAQRIR